MGSDKAANRSRTAGHGEAPRVTRARAWLLWLPTIGGRPASRRLTPDENRLPQGREHGAVTPWAKPRLKQLASSPSPRSSRTPAAYMAAAGALRLSSIQMAPPRAASEEGPSNHAAPGLPAGPSLAAFPASANNLMRVRPCQPWPPARDPS